MIFKRIQLDEKYNNVFLDVYVADKTENFTRNAILVIPGGGYRNICSNREGEPIAMAFMPYGYNAFVLSYSVSRQKTFPGQLIEASLAMKHIKDHAEEYNIDPERVFVVEGTDLVPKTNYLTIDMVHPSTAGHIDMGYNLYNMVKDWLK